MSGLNAMFKLLSVVQNVVYPPLSQGVIASLGPTVLVTIEVLERVDVGGLAYNLVGPNPVVREAVTGAVVTGDLELMVDQFNHLATQPGWMNRALIVIVAEEENYLVFREFWSRRTSNVLFHTPEGVIAYNPFTEVQFRVEDDSQVETILKKRWTDMNGCSVVVDIYRHTLGYVEGRNISLGAGIDASALNELSKYWNISMSLYNPLDFEGEVNSDTSDKHLLAGKTELSMNARFMIKAEQVYLEYTTTAFADSVVIVMRKPEKLRGWDVFIRTLHWKVWLAILLTIIIMDRFLLISSTDKCHRRTLTLTLRSVFAIPVRKPPDHFRDRLVVGCALFISTVLVNAYTASLYHMIESHQTYKLPQTLMEFNKFGIPLLATSPGLEVYFRMRKKYEIKKMAERIKVKNNINDELLQHNAYVMRETEMRILMDTNMIRKDIHFVTEKVLSFTMAYVVKRGSPFLEPLSDFTSRAFEAGLHKWWYTMTVISIGELHSRNVSHNIEPSSKKLKISDIEVAFVGLIAGQAISLVVFLLELIVKHIVRGRFRITRKLLRKILDLCPQDRIDFNP